MIFTETPLRGAFLIRLEKLVDQRGYFARTFCQREFEGHGLESKVVQCNVSFNRRKGTLRGMHWQAPPCAETKLVSCIRGAIHDVVVDLRPDSPTFMRHFAAELSEANGDMLYVPEGFAHGFQTLQENTAVFYQMSQFYSAEHARGLRWDDPAFGIAWPEDDRLIIERDRNYPLYSPGMVFQI